MGEQSEVDESGAMLTVARRNLVLQTEWYRSLGKYEVPHAGKAVWQLVNTIVPYVVLWTLMVLIIRHGLSYWLTLPLIVVAGALSVRIFIFFHDCCHNCFFGSKKANRFWGYVCGILTFTPFDDWRHEHSRHHASAGDLDRRGTGDVWTMTVAEYQSAPRRTKIGYRIFRHPIIMFVFGPPIVFFVSQRVRHKGVGKLERDSVIRTNLALLTILFVSIWTIGLRTYLLIQIPVMSVAGIIGAWMFYIQHQFEEVYWARHQEWDPLQAALEGSSYYKLPKLMQWFTGNIGLHHIHHLRPRIPNYSLQRCYDDIPALQTGKPLTFLSSFKSLFLNVYDEASKKLVGFRRMKRITRKREAQSREASQVDATVGASAIQNTQIHTNAFPSSQALVHEVIRAENRSVSH